MPMVALGFNVEVSKGMDPCAKVSLSPVSTQLSCTMSSAAGGLATPRVTVNCGSCGLFSCFGFLLMDDIS